VFLAQSLRGSRANVRLVQRLQSALANAVGSRAASAWRACLQPARAEKRIHPDLLAESLQAIARHAGTTPPTVMHAKHPMTGALLSTLVVAP
jgi:hypothetical protein